MSGLKKTKTQILDTTNNSKGFLSTGKTSGMRGRGAANRSPDNDDAVLVEDNSSNGSSKGKGKMKRFTPVNQRRPKVLFFRDPNIIDEYKSIKQRMMDRSKADSRNEVLNLDTSVHAMQDEIKYMK